MAVRDRIQPYQYYRHDKKIINCIHNKNNNLKLVELSNDLGNKVYLFGASSKRTHPLI